MLFACMFVPDFAVQSALRCEPDQIRKCNQPVAVVDGSDSLLRVFACNREAELAGIEVDMTKVQAEQCPGLLLRRRVLAQENATQSALIDCASAFSPLIESTAEGAVTIEITGTDRVFGTSQRLARRAVQSAALLGLKVTIALAENADAALLAAKGSSGIVVIPSGQEAEHLAPLPVEVLSPTEEQAEILDSWGIRTCGDLASLPQGGLVERLGQTGLHLQTLARGQVQRTLLPVNSPPKFEERIELEDSVEDLVALAFILNRLLNQLSARLGARGLAICEVRLRLDLEVHPDRDLREEAEQAPSRGFEFEHNLKMPVPIEDTKILLKLLQLDLAAHNPGAPVKAIAMEAMPAKRRYTQAGLFTPRAPEAERLEVTLARLRAVVGQADEQGRGRVGAPEVCKSNKPDDFRVDLFTAQITTKANQLSPSNNTEVALSIFRPLLTARVRRNGGKLVHISFGQISTEILCAAGPWFTSGMWWHETERWNREEWDIAIRLEHGLGIYRIFHDEKNRAWFVEGLYN